MSRIRFQVKENGRQILKGSWIKAILILLLTAMLYFGLSALEEGYRDAFDVPRMLNDKTRLNLSVTSFIISGVSSLLSLLFLPPLLIGQTEWYWRLSEGKTPGIGDIFSWFGSLRFYFKSVWFYFNFFLKYLLWSVLICGLPAGMAVYGYYLVYYQDNTLYQALGALLAVLALILMLGAILLLLLVMMRYFLAAYLLVEDNTRRVGSCFKDSRLITKGRRWELCKFILSFIPWFITLYLVFPALYVLPFLSASSTVYAKHLIYVFRAKNKPNKGDTMEFTAV